MGGRIVVVTPTEPAPFGSASARGYYALLKGLTDRGFSVRCLSGTDNRLRAEEAQHAAKQLGVQLSMYPVVARPMSWSRKWATLRRPFSYSLSDGLRRDFEKELRDKPDIVHLEQLWTGYLAEGVPHALVVMHHLGSIDLRGPARRSGKRFLFEKLLVLRGERTLLRRLHNVAALSNRLASAARSINRWVNVSVIPFGIDASLYDFRVEDPVSEPVVGFIGNMRWAPNYAAARRLVVDVFPLVKSRIPAARLLIGGWYAEEAFGVFKQDSALTILSDVPDSREFFRRLQVLTLPLVHASGVKVKALEAMAWGVPVVTTTDGVEGLAALNGEHCFVAEDSQGLADRTVELLGSPDLRRTMRARARVLVEEEHSPHGAVDLLTTIYQTL